MALIGEARTFLVRLGGFTQLTTAMIGFAINET
jgi:hypothetical protein